MNFGQKIKFTHKFGLFTVIILILFFINIPRFDAQQMFWSQQEKIPEYYDSTEEPPFLIADQNHTVHAFNSQPLDLGNPDSTRAIFYRQWTIETGWTFPNDILFDARGMDLIGATGDQSGKVHLALLIQGQLYYSQAFLLDAGNASAWSIPVLLGDNAMVPRRGFERVGWIASDASGNNIIIVYSGLQYGDGLYFVGSFDGGNSWSKPYPIYLAGDQVEAVYEPKLFNGKSGVLHAVWGTRLKDGLGGPGYYANFNWEDHDWSDPMELDTSGLGSPSVIEYEGNVFSTYILWRLNTNLWRRSIDGGKTWSTPSQLSPQHIGSNGLVSFAVDGNDTLHAFFGQRINDENHGMWHITWTDYGWTSAEAVVRGPKVRDVDGGKGFDPQSARAVIVNGNIALVTWATDGSSGMNGVWFSYKTLDTRELPAMPLPIPSPTNEQVSTQASSIPTKISPVENTANNIPSNILNGPRAITQNPQTYILWGIIPVLIILIGILLFRGISIFMNK